MMVALFSVKNSRRYQGDITLVLSRNILERILGMLKKSWIQSF